MTTTPEHRRVTAQPGHRRVVVEPAVIRPSSGFRIGWVLITLAAAVQTARSASSWSYFQDDWVLVVDASQSSLPHFMAQAYNGHLMPGGGLLVWLTTALDPLDYSWVVLITVAMVVCMLAAWGLALRELFGERLHLLGVLALLAFSPPMTTVALWWAGNLLSYPLVTATGLAVWFLARYLLRGERAVDRVGVLLSVLLGLFFWHKAVLIVIPLVGLPLLVVAGPVRERVRTGLRGVWPSLALVAAYWVVYLAVPRPELDLFPVEFPQLRNPGDVAEFLFIGVTDMALPALLGGPFATISSAYGVYEAAPAALRVLVLAAAGVGTLLALRYRNRAGWALLLGATYVCTAWGVVLFSSRYEEVGDRLIFEGRYLCDMLPVLLLAVTFLTTRLREATHDPLARALPPAGLTAVRVARAGYVALAACLALVLTLRNWDATEPSSPKPWVDAVVGDARQAGAATLYDSVAPDNAINSLFYFGRANLSDLLSPLDLPLRFNEPAPNGLLVTDEDGHLFEGEVLEPAVSSVAPGPVEACGYAVQPGEKLEVPLTGGIYEFQWIVQVDYFASAPAWLTVTTDDVETDVPLVADKLARVQYVVVDSVNRLALSLAEGTEAVCVTTVKVGNVAATDRRPAPLPPLE